MDGYRKKIWFGDRGIIYNDEGAKMVCREEPQVEIDGGEKCRLMFHELIAFCGNGQKMFRFRGMIFDLSPEKKNIVVDGSGCRHTLFIIIPPYVR